MAVRKAGAGPRRKHPVRTRSKSLVCVTAAGLALCLPDRPLAIPAPTEWRPVRAAERASAAWPLPEAQPRRLSQAEFDQLWGQVKSAMAACNNVVEGVQLNWRVRGDSPVDADMRLVRDRCQRASVEVGEAAIPASARAQARTGTMLEQAREACQRSMVEKQLGLAALQRLAETPPDSLEAYEARIRMEAIPRSSINCGTGFAAAAAVAGLRMSEIEVAGA